MGINNKNVEKLVDHKQQKTKQNVKKTNLINQFTLDHLIMKSLILRSIKIIKKVILIQDWLLVETLKMSLLQIKIIS